MKRSVFLPVLLAAAVALTACSGAKQNAETKSTGTKPAAEAKVFKTDLGDLKLDHTPTRVVAISLQAIDSLVALGVKPVGYAEPGGEPIDYLGDALKGIPSVGTHSKPSLEQIAALKPDLIIVDTELQKDLVPELQKIAPVAGFRSFSVDDTMGDLKTIGQILGKEKEAEKFVADFKAEEKSLTAKAQGKQAPKWMAIFGTAEKPGVWLKDSFIGSILTSLNAQPAYVGAPDPKYPDLVYLSIEKIAEANPGIFFIMSTPGKEISKAWSSNPAYKGTDAVKQSRVHEVNRNLWSRSRGPIAAKQILEQAFPLLYPDVK
jgi:iron complex transport system substrate-binding protein